MKENIILIGCIYYGNLGDAALCYCVKELLSGYFDVTILDIYGRTEFPTHSSLDTQNCKKNYKHIVNRTKLRKLFLHLGLIPYDRKKAKTFKEVGQQLRKLIDERKPVAIVFAGGALFKGVFIKSIEKVVEIAESCDIQIVYNACGIDYEMLPIEWKRIGILLRNKSVRYVSVRDGYHLMEKKFPDVNIHRTYDPAICSCRFFEPSNERNGIGLGIMMSHYFDFDMQVDFWGRLIQRLNDDKREWKMFTNGAPADQDFAAYILKQNNESEYRLVKCPENPEELYKNISGFKGIVSMRLHSHILAYSSCTPSVAITWDRKVEDFFSLIGKSFNCLTFSTSIEEILNKVDLSIADKSYFENKYIYEGYVDAHIDSIINALDNRTSD